MRRKIFSRMLRLGLAAGLIACLLAIGILDILHNQVVRLPVPTGPYSVGRAEYDWVDTGRSDPFDPNQPRMLNVWIWYPIDDPPAGAVTAPYLPADWIEARKKLTGIGSLLMQNLADVRGNSYEAAPLSARMPEYPVLVFEPGLGPILPDYSSICEDLASHGYIVVGSTPTGSASVVVFNDGEAAVGTPQGNVPDNASVAEAGKILDRLIEVWGADVRFLLDQIQQLNDADPEARFSGRLDLSELGVMGHSFGGATAAWFCSKDPRCKAGIDLDGYLYGDMQKTGLNVPFMFIWSEPQDRNDPIWRNAMQESGRVFELLPPGSYQISVKGMRHFNFSDNAVGFQPLLHLLGYLGAIDGEYGLEITRTYVTSFFNEALLGNPQAVFEKSPYPEVQIDKR